MREPGAAAQDPGAGNRELREGGDRFGRGFWLRGQQVRVIRWYPRVLRAFRLLSQNSASWVVSPNLSGRPGGVRVRAGADEGVLEALFSFPEAIDHRKCLADGFAVELACAGFDAEEFPLSDDHLISDDYRRQRPPALQPVLSEA